MANFGTYIIGILKNKEVYGPIVAILVGLVVYKICKSIVARIINYEKSNDNGSYSYKKRRTVIDLISNIIRYIIFVVVIMAILEVYSINTTGILASLGVASAVLGLAFQDALKDFIGEFPLF